jgi:hypothetical protein
VETTLKKVQSCKNVFIVSKNPKKLTYNSVKQYFFELTTFKMTFRDREIDVRSLLHGRGPFWSTSAQNRRLRTSTNAFWMILKH